MSDDFLRTENMRAIIYSLIANTRLMIASGIENMRATVFSIKKTGKQGLPRERKQDSNVCNEESGVRRGRIMKRNDLNK